MLHRPITSLLMLFILASGSQLTRADDGLQDVEVGLGTKHWLELQRSGFIASQQRQTISGPIASEIYQRYVDSFKYPIPEVYKSERESSNSSQ